MLENITDFVGSLTFLGYVITFNVAFLCGCMFAGANRGDELEGVGQGPVCTRKERAVPQAGPGGGA